MHRTFAWALAALAVAFGLLTLFIAAATPWSVGQGGFEPPPFAQAIAVFVFFVSSPVIGALIVVRAGRNPLGWLFIVIAGSLAFGLLADSLATRALLTGQELGGIVLAKWLSSWLSVPAFGSIPLLALLFPDGRPPSPRWRPIVWTSFAAMVLGAISEAARPDVTVFGGGAPVAIGPNPLGLDQLGAISSLLGTVAVAGIGGSAVLATLGLAVRFRRSRGIERQQLKWFAFAMALLAALIVGASILDAVSSLVPAAGAASELLWILAISSLALLPMAAAVAIFRYRLYDIDVLINRTLVYAALSAALGAIYVAAVIGAQALLGPFTGGSEFAVAGSTLLVVALFQPLRRWIQTAVDRRFYRERYDAQRTVDAFSTRLRHQVELDAVQADLVGVVHDTIRPAHASLWLRERA